MGQGIANWLFYRHTEGTLSLSTLVMSHGAATPVHDHLAWGLVGLYAGEQVEEVYEAAAPLGPDDRHADLKLVANNHLERGSLYTLIPPAGDIHRVITAGAEPSVSLHLLGNDVGRVSRMQEEAVAPSCHGTASIATSARTSQTTSTIPGSSTTKTTRGLGLAGASGATYS